MADSEHQHRDDDKQAQREVAEKHQLVKIVLVGLAGQLLEDGDASEVQ